VVGVPRPRLMLPTRALPLIAGAIDALRDRGIRLPVDGNQTRLGGLNLFFDFRKAWEAFGPPQFDMAQSVRDTDAWYRANGYA
jgi:hypothetical protein